MDIALLMRGSRTDSWKYTDQIDETATELASRYFAVVNFVLLPYDEFEEKKSWYGYFKNIEQEGIYRIRNVSDYDDFYIVNKEETKELLQFVKDFLEKAEEYIATCS